MIPLIEEIKRQFSHSSLGCFPLTNPQLVKAESQQLIKNQVVQAIKDKKKQLIFILSPNGSGTTTLLRSLMKENPSVSYRYRSFIRIESFDFAFLYLTEPKMRFFFFFFFILIAYFLFPLLPGAAVMPMLLILTLSILKSFGHLVYLMHEILDNLIHWKSKVYILEDLSKAPLDSNQKWEFLASLWKNKRTYIVTYGYSLQKPDERVELIENAVKLGGVIIQAGVDEKANEAFIHQLEPDFPFVFRPDKKHQKGWLSLFTFRDLKMLHEQVVLQEKGEGGLKVKDKQILYVKFILSLLLAKLKLPNQEFIFDAEKKTVQMPPKDKLSLEQAHFLNSFSHSLKLSANL